MRYVEIACRLLLATVFAGALAGKVLSRSSLRAFVTSLRTMAVLPDRLVAPAAAASVTTEALVLLLMLVPIRWTAAVGFVIAAGLLAVFAVAIGLSLRRGRRVPCRCFGASTTPLGPRHIARNIVLIAVALLGLVAAVATGPLELGPALVLGTVGLVLGLFTTGLDDIVALVRPGN